MLLKLPYQTAPYCLIFIIFKITHKIYFTVYTTHTAKNIIKMAIK